MNSLTFLLLRQMKNRIKEVFKSPGKLIPYILGIGFTVFLVVSSMTMEMPEPEYGAFEPNFTILQGIFFGFFAFTFIGTALPALKGTSQYGMEDVNFLFVSPIRARTILLYGIIQSFKTIIIGSWFVLFQAEWMRSGYGIGMGGVMTVWLGYVLFALACQLVAIFLYAMTRGDLRKIFYAKCVLAAAFVPVVAAFVLNFLGGFDALAGLSATLDSVVPDITPLVGWASAGIVALIGGEIFAAVMFLGAVVVFSAILVTIIFVKDPDFYEHVAGATQSMFEMQRAAAEGDMSAAMGADSKKTRVKRTGITHGAGASVFFSKHVRESFRQKRFGLWGLPTLFYIVGAGVFAFISRGNDYMPMERVVMLLLLTMLMIGFFSSGMGRGALEIYNHYIYMIPENPLKKWFWANAEMIFKVAVEGVLIFGVAAVVFGASPHNFAMAGIVYITFMFYLTGASLAFMRLTGIASRSVFLSIVMMFAYFVPLIPGAVAAIAVAMLMFNAGAYAFALTVGLAIFTAWQVTVGIACFALSQGMLHDCDMLSMDVMVKNLQN